MNHRRQARLVLALGSLLAALALVPGAATGAGLVEYVLLCVPANGPATASQSDGTCPARTTTVPVPKLNLTDPSFAALNIGHPAGGPAATFNNATTFNGGATFSNAATFGGSSTFNGTTTFSNAATFRPSGDTPALVVQQSGAGRTADVWSVLSPAGAKYLHVDSSGTVHWSGTAMGEAVEADRGTFHRLDADEANVGGCTARGGTISCPGGKFFQIEHPLDGKKWLYHAAIESPEVLNLYNGNATTDARGYAVVRLPRYFTEINRDFRYQLTVIGSFAQAVVWKEIRSNRFTIRTSNPHVKVSWQVTGVRNDAYVRMHPFRAEVPKDD